MMPKRALSLVIMLAALVLVWCGTPVLRADRPVVTDKDVPDAGKVAAELVKALKMADVVFTAKIGKVQPIGMTNSIPASVFGKVTFKDLKPLHGAVPKAATFSFSYREGMAAHIDLMAEGTVLVALKKDGVLAVAVATDANLALVKKTLAVEQK